MHSAHGANPKGVAVFGNIIGICDSSGRAAAAFGAAIRLDAG